MDPSGSGLDDTERDDIGPEDGERGDGRTDGDGAGGKRARHGPDSPARIAGGISMNEPKRVKRDDETAANPEAGTASDAAAPAAAEADGARRAPAAVDREAVPDHADAGRADAVAELQARIVKGLAALDTGRKRGRKVAAAVAEPRSDAASVPSASQTDGGLDSSTRGGVDDVPDGAVVAVQISPGSASEVTADTAQDAHSDAGSLPEPPLELVPVSEAATGEAVAVPPLADPAIREAERIVEALLFASPEPLDETQLAAHLPAGMAVAPLLEALRVHYETRGVQLVRVSGKWMFRTAGDLGWLMERHAVEERRLSRAALETLAIIAYHQPVTRAEIEEIRGVATSRGTLDVLMEAGWVRPRGRRRAPGKPVTYGTTDGFLTHFGLDQIKDLPGLADLRGAGLLDGNLPPGFRVPDPTDVAALMPDELPLEDEPEDATQSELDLEPLEDDTADENDGESLAPPQGRATADEPGRGDPSTSA